jgi:molybdenum cofactor guanylyltransferase
MKYTAENMTGVILAGGENKRFGGIVKSNILVGGSPIISRMTAILSGIFTEIIIVTNTPEEFKAYRQYEIVKDEVLKVGPLGGIHAAMKNSSHKSAFVFGGDMPFINSELIIKQVNYFSSKDTEVVIPRFAGKIEPLHAVYSCSILEKLTGFLSETTKFSVRDFLAIANVSYLDLPDSEETRKAFININTPEEAEKATEFFKV